MSNSVAVVVAAAAVGLAAPAAATVRSGLPISGGTPTQRALLRQIVHSLGGTQIRGIRIVTASGGVRLVMQPAQFDRSSAGRSVRREWDGHLVAYSLLRLSLRRSLPIVRGFSIDGRTRVFGSTRARPLPPFNRASIVPPVGRAVKASGAKVVELNLFRPAGPAFAVVVAADHPGRFIRRRLEPIIAALNHDQARLDGFYVAVADARRSVVFAYATTGRPDLAASTLYVRPDLLGCAENLPVQNEVAPDGAPPCPED